MSDADEIPYSAWLMALLSLPRMGPNRLAGLLAEHPAPACWDRLVSGAELGTKVASADVVGEWRRAARSFDVHDRWQQAHTAGISLHDLGAPGYPPRLINDIEPPVLVFTAGRALPVDRPSVAIVGTRTCTAYGRRVAFDFGAALAEAAVHVVSGLAIGIDAAAHQGALSVEGASPIAVVGSGLDVVYPRRNRALWEQVADRGTLVSEAPPGAPPERWRFPARNRIIAGLADAVVVVESHRAGGSLLTVDEAQLRDVPVGAIPGPIGSPASEGTNRLLVDGAVPVTCLDDLLLLIGHVAPRVEAVGPECNEPTVVDPSRDLLDAMGWSPVLFEQLCLRVSMPASKVAAELERLISVGACSRSGPWIERTN